MRGMLDRLYAGAHWLACASLCVITALVVVQVGARVLDKILQAFGIPPVGFIIPSLAEFAGFLMVGATFLALASTLKRGVHIRVTVVLGLLPEWAHGVLNIIVGSAAAVLFGFVAWHAAWLAVDSWDVGSVSYGIVPVALWIPQSVMALGLIVFAVALVDEVWETLSKGTPEFERHRTSVLDEGEHE